MGSQASLLLYCSLGTYLVGAEAHHLLGLRLAEQVAVCVGACVYIIKLVSALTNEQRAFVGEGRVWSPTNVRTETNGIDTFPNVW